MTDGIIMLRVKALHFVFMVTWFAGLSIFLPGRRPAPAGSGALAAKSIRRRLHPLRVCAAAPGRENSPAHFRSTSCFG